MDKISITLEPVDNNRLTEANENLKLKTLSNYSTLLKIAQKTEYISESECKILEKWNQNPSSWS